MVTLNSIVDTFLKLDPKIMIPIFLLTSLVMGLVIHIRERKETNK